MMKSKMQDNENEAIEALGQLKHQNGRSAMAPRQMIQLGGGEAEVPRPCDLKELKKSLAGKKFPLKLYEVVDYAPLDMSIRWNSEGTAVVIPDPDSFEKHGLCLLSKNYATFKRQMNYYGFRKKNNVSDLVEYVHKDHFFLRDQKELLEKFCTSSMPTKKRARAEGTEQPLTSPRAKITSCINNVISAQANVTSLVLKLNALMEHVTPHGDIVIPPHVTSLCDKIASFKALNDAWVDKIHSAIEQFPDLVANGRSSSG